MPHRNSKYFENKGFTLIETVIYIALFSIIIFGGFVAAFQLIQGTDTLNAITVREGEINFVLRKINYALNSVENISKPSALNPSSNILEVTKYDGTKISIRLNSDPNNKKIEISKNGGIFLPITTDNVEVTSLQFKYIPQIGNAPAGIEATFTLNGVTASTTRYIRK